MAIVKTLDILLRAKTSNLSKDLAGANKELDKFFGRFQSVVGSIVTGVSLAGMVAKFRSVFQELDELAKRSLRFGIDPMELSALERAASLAGISVEQLTTSYSLLNRQIAAAQQGSAQQREAFKSLGVSLEALSRATPTEQWMMLGKAFAGIENRAKRIDLAMRLFGRSGGAMLQLLADGGASVGESFKEIQRLGGGFTSSDLAKVELANDTWEDFTRTVNNVWKAMAIQLAPTFTLLTRQLIEAFRPGTALNGMMRGLGDVLGFVLNLMTMLAIAVRGISELFGSWSGRVVAIVIGMYGLVRVGRMLAALYAILRVRAAVLLAIETARAALDPVNRMNLAKSAAAFGVVITAILGMEQQLSAATEKVKGLNDEMLQTVKIGGGMGRVNVGTAAFGSQESLSTVLAVRASGPMDQMVNLQKQANGILGAINDGVNGLDFEALELEGQGAF